MTTIPIARLDDVAASFHEAALVAALDKLTAASELIRVLTEEQNEVRFALARSTRHTDRSVPCLTCGFCVRKFERIPFVFDDGCDEPEQPTLAQGEWSGAEAETAAELEQLRVAQILFDEEPHNHPSGRVPKWDRQPMVIRVAFLKRAERIITALRQPAAPVPATSAPTESGAEAVAQIITEMESVALCYPTISGIGQTLNDWIARLAALRQPVPVPSPPRALTTTEELVGENTLIGPGPVPAPGVTVMELIEALEAAPKRNGHGECLFCLLPHGGHYPKCWVAKVEAALSAALRPKE